jgi:hypothetical protein
MHEPVCLGRQPLQASVPYMRALGPQGQQQLPVH